MATVFKPSTFEVKIMCKIISVEETDIDFGSMVVIEPVGSEIRFALGGGPLNQVMCNSVGHTVKAVLEASYSTIEPTDERTVSIASLKGEPLSDSSLNVFRAVGLYVGHNESSFLVQSLFLILAEGRFGGDCYLPKIGEWVAVTGELVVFWDEADVLKPSL